MRLGSPTARARRELTDIVVPDFDRTP